jgi:hypothetical protein
MEFLNCNMILNKNLHIINGFKLTAAFSGPQNRVYLSDNTETPTPGYTLINAGVGAGFTNKRINFYLIFIYSPTRLSMWSIRITEPAQVF